MERVQKQAKPRDNDEVTEVSVAPSKRLASSKEETDALLDEIDAVLEQNATEFIRDYVQRGGQ